MSAKFEEKKLVVFCPKICEIWKKGCLFFQLLSTETINTCMSNS